MGKRANGVIRRGIMQAIVSNCRIVEIIIGEDNSRIEGVKVTGTEYSRTTVTSARIIQIIIHNNRVIREIMRSNREIIHR